MVIHPLKHLLDFSETVVEDSANLPEIPPGLGYSSTLILVCRQECKGEQLEIKNATVASVKP